MKQVLTRKTASSETIDINSIATQLYMLPTKLQFCHHNTRMHSKHESLNVYDALNDMRDDILEKLIGYLGGERYTKLSLVPIMGYDESMPDRVADEVIEFGRQLQNWASSMGFGDIENIAQSYSGEGAKLKYFLTQQG